MNFDDERRSSQARWIVTIAVIVFSCGLAMAWGARGWLRSRRAVPVVEPIALVEASSSLSVRDQAPAVQPADLARVAMGRERVGALTAWRSTEEPCPIALPSLPTQIERVRNRVLEVDEPQMPVFPYPIVFGRDEEHLLERLAAEVDEPTLVVWEQTLVEPRSTDRRRFEPGMASGLAFLRVPGRAGFACAGTFTATNSELVRAGRSQLGSQETFDELFVLFDLQLQARRAAAASLRAVVSPREPSTEPRPARAPARVRR